jgi:hypothetical protein
MERRPLLERVALDYFGRLSAGREFRRDERAHILDAGERDELRGLERGAIIRAGVAGALSSVFSGIAEVYADATFPNSTTVNLGLMLGATAIASVVEILYLYWDALRTVHRMAAAAGLALVDVQKGEVATALARAALELPNPPEVLFGVDPRREASKAQLLVAGVLYKGKTALTTFLIKLLIRRAISRAAVRTFVLPFVAVPVTALWNAWVTWSVVREARVRAIGPSAILEVLKELHGGAPPSKELQETLLRGVASSIVRKRSMHPNLRMLLVAVHGEMSHEQLSELDSTREFLEHLRRHSPEEQRLVLRLLCVALVIDGKISRRDRQLLREASAACAMSVTDAQLEALRLSFLSGEGFSPEQLHKVAL